MHLKTFKIQYGSIKVLTIFKIKQNKMTLKFKESDST